MGADENSPPHRQASNKFTGPSQIGNEPFTSRHASPAQSVHGASKRPKKDSPRQPSRPGRKPRQPACQAGRRPTTCYARISWLRRRQRVHHASKRRKSRYLGNHRDQPANREIPLGKPEDATSRAVQRSPRFALQAGGRRFDPGWLHCSGVPHARPVGGDVVSPRARSAAPPRPLQHDAIDVPSSDTTRFTPPFASGPRGCAIGPFDRAPADRHVPVETDPRTCRFPTSPPVTPLVARRERPVACRAPVAQRGLDGRRAPLPPAA